MNTETDNKLGTDAPKQQAGATPQARGVYQYPGLGDPPPVGGETVLLLTEGGACVSGVWKDGAGFIAWCKKPARDRAKEDRLQKN